MAPAVIAWCFAWVILLCGATCPCVEPKPVSSPAKPVASGTEYAPLAIRLDNKFYNRPNGFKVRDGRLSFMHLEGSASIPVEGLGANELSQFPAALREQIAAEVVAVAKRREEEAKLAEQTKAGSPMQPLGSRGGRFPGSIGNLAGPDGSLRNIPVEPKGGGAVEVEKVSPRAGGALDGRTADGGGDFGVVPQPSKEVVSAIESHGRATRMAASDDMAGAVGELHLLSRLSPVSRADGEYIDATVLDASLKVLEEALRLNDPVAGERSVSVASSVGGTRPEVVKFLQGVFDRLGIMADRSEFAAVGRWVECLEEAGPAYGIVLEMGRQRVARRVLKSGTAELWALHPRKAWEAYVLSKGLWVDNPDLAPIGLIAGICGTIAIGFVTVVVFKSVDGLRALRARRSAEARRDSATSNWVVQRTDPGSVPGRPSTGPRPTLRQRPET